MLPSLPTLHIFLSIRDTLHGPGEMGPIVLQGLGIGAYFSDDDDHHHQSSRTSLQHSYRCCAIYLADQVIILGGMEGINIINPRN